MEWLSAWSEPHNPRRTLTIPESLARSSRPDESVTLEVRRTTTTNERTSGDDGERSRIGHACRRCRRMKLKCVGGHPCRRCQRALQSCDFVTRANRTTETASNPTERLAQLETAVQTLITNLSGVSPEVAAMASTLTGVNAVFQSSDCPAGVSSANPSSSTGFNLVEFPDANHPTDDTLDNTLDQASQPSAQAVSPFPASFQLNQAGQHSPEVLSNRVSFQLSPSITNLEEQPSRSLHPSPESRLAAAQSGSMVSAAFHPLLIRPAVWENVEQSRPGSPGSIQEGSWSLFGSLGGPFEDPVNNGTISPEVSEALVDFFFSKCHHLLPLIHLDPSDGTDHDQLRQRSPFLYTTVLAIAARLYAGHLKHFPSAGSPHIDEAAPSQIRRLAYSHLAATMMRKEHKLSDVQATLFLSVWGLMPNGKGPDPWLLTGHCRRMGQRLGFEKISSRSIVTKAYARGVNLEPEEKLQLDKAMMQWKTSLSYYYFDGFLSLGFGRPLSSQLNPLNEHIYLQLVQNRSRTTPSLGDMYTASMVQLSTIGRELIDWLQGLSERPLLDDNRLNDHQGFAFRAASLNKRLDDWESRWSWNGSILAIKLGPGAQFAKLQAQHVRLCVNSIALNPDWQENCRDEQDLITSCIQKASQAAINMIQMHIDAAESDHAFSYSFEYIYNALAQAAVFAIRLYLTRDPIPVDRSVLVHYTSAAILVIEKTDFSVTGHSSTLAKICRDLCRVAGVDIGDPELQRYTHGDDQGESHIPTTQLADAPFDLEAYLQTDASGMDFNFMLGWPMDSLLPEEIE